MEKPLKTLCGKVGLLSDIIRGLDIGCRHKIKGIWKDYVNPYLDPTISGVTNISLDAHANPRVAV